MRHEYEVVCETCGVEYVIALTMRVERISPESLARVLDALHPKPLCSPATGIVLHSEPRQP